MVNISPLRSITTPRNFIFEPLGTERIETLRSLVAALVCVGITSWPRTIGAANIRAANMQPTVNGRNLLKLIVCSFNPIEECSSRTPGTCVGAIFKTVGASNRLANHVAESSVEYCGNLVFVRNLRVIRVKRKKTRMTRWWASVNRLQLRLTRRRFQPHHAHVSDDVSVVQIRMAHVGEQRSQLRVFAVICGGAAADCFLEFGYERVFVGLSVLHRRRVFNLGSDSTRTEEV